MCTRFTLTSDREEGVRLNSFQKTGMTRVSQLRAGFVSLCALSLLALPAFASGVHGSSIPSVHDLEITQGGTLVRPSLPSVHDLEDLPSVHDLEDVPSVHDLEDVPSVHDLEDAPSVHDLEDVPSVHDLEDAPSVHDLEDAPSVHDLEESAAQ